MMKQKAENGQLHNEQGTSRETSYELLRILAMCMIISLHYLSKGNVLTSLADSGKMNAAEVAAWVVEALCLPAVNVYVLISGYFGRSGSFRMSKVIRLWGTAIFYSVGITLILGMTGNLTTAQGTMAVSELTIYDWMNVVFPVVTEEYWFLTAYLILYLFMPFLNAGMEKLSQKDFRRILISLLIFFSVAKSVLPMQLPTDHKGYDVLWFVCLYLLGGYFGRYGCKVFERLWSSALLYLLSALGIVGLAFGARHLYLTKGMLADFALTNYFYTYNHILCLTASIGLFGMFTRLHMKKQKLSGCICYAASCTMAVYLIHEQLYLRYLWPKWFGVQKQAGSFIFLPHMLVTVVCVFLVCTAVESIRKRIVRCIWHRR